MSTRGAVGFIADNKKYVAYNHCDSYPSYLGMEVLKFCKSVKDWNKVKSRVKNIQFIDEETKPTLFQIIKYMHYSDRVVQDHRLDNWYVLLRDVQGADTLREIAKGRLNHITDASTFLENALFCEWAYIIDLDKNTLNVFESVPDGADYKLELLKSYKLNRLPKFIVGVSEKFKRQYKEKNKNE